MKVFAVVLLLAFVAGALAAFTEEEKKNIKILEDECIKETGVTTELIAGIHKGEFPEDQKLKDFTFCMGKKLGFINEAGECLIDAIKSKFFAEHTAEEADAFVKACATKTHGSGAENAYQFVKCHYEKYPEHFKH